MCRIVPLKGAGNLEMKRSLLIALVAGGLSMAGGANCPAQNPPAQNPPANNTQSAPAQPKPAEGNPFPEDTTKVPVFPSKGSPALPPDTGNGDDSAAAAAHVTLRSDDVDPVRSPDDAPTGAADSAMELNSSDSRSGMDKILPPQGDDDEPQGKHRKLAVPGPEHQETSKEDIEVGGYYLETRNWKAALSRFESALVLAPDEPEVYWGLAESSRHLGNLAAARGYYQKVAEYDPDSRHGKEAAKALREPEIANAKAVAPAN
jgi:hypothetical protein